jgi:hypothetical protein
MTNHSILTPRLRRAVLLAISLTIASPSFADHLGPSGFGSGGGATVFGPDTLDAAHWVAGVRLSYTRPEQRPDVKLDALAAQGVDAHNTDYNINASLGVAYGVTHHLTIAAELPYVRRDHLREGTSDGVEDLGSVSGLGDVSLLAKYRLTEGEKYGFAFIAGGKLPTGSTHKRSPDGERLETEHQPGTGSWDPIVGASASTPLGLVTLTASALYQFTNGGAQHTRLGDRLQGGAALSHRFGAAPHGHVDSHNHHHGDELDEDHEERRASWDLFVELAGEWEGRQTIAGEVEAASGGEWAYVAPGVRFNAAPGWSASAALALPVWQRIRDSHPDNRFRLMLSLGSAF